MTEHGGLVAFLRARLDEDEAGAKKAQAGPWMTGAVAKHLVDKVVYGQSTSWPGHITQVCNVEYADGGLPNAEHIARHDPARVLREVEAVRRIVDLHAGAHDCPQFLSNVYPVDWPADAPYGKAGDRWEHSFDEHFEDGEACPTKRLLAAIWSDHPDYRPEWRPE